MLKILTVILLLFSTAVFAQTNLNVTATPLPLSVQNTHYYSTTIAGPSFLVIQYTNNGSKPVYVSNVSAPKAHSGISIANGVYTAGKECEAGKTKLDIANSGNNTCYIILKASPGDPAVAPLSATLSVTVGTSFSSPNTQTLVTSLQNQTILYAGGKFRQIGNSPLLSANQDMIAQCSYSVTTKKMQCSNAITDSHNAANGTVNRISVANNGNLYIGGAFSQIGNASVPASKYVLAKCVLGSCMNALQGETPYANQPIETISVGHNLYILTAGKFSQIGTVGVNPGKYLVAMCNTAGDGTCQNFFQSTAQQFYPEADGPIYGVRYNAHVNINGQQSNSIFIAGAFKSINGFYSGLTGKQSFVAVCTAPNDTNLYTCSNALPNNPTTNTIPTNSANNTIHVLDMLYTSSQVTFFLAGKFNAIAGVSVPSKQYLLAQYIAPHSNIASGHALNFLSNPASTTPYANNQIIAIVSSVHADTLFVAGKFSQIGNVPDVGVGHYLLAKCNNKGCVNALASTGMPYADGEIKTLSTGSVLSAQ